MSFYGMTIEEYRRMPHEDLMGLWHAITVLEARDQLQRLRVQDWPKLKETTRKKYHSELSKEAYPQSLKKVDGKVMSTAEFASFIASGGKKRG